jgi:hypothetical protein
VLLLAALLSLLCLAASAKDTASEQFEAENYDTIGEGIRMAEAGASGGAFIQATAGINRKGYVFASGYDDIPPGRYRATWVLKTGDIGVRDTVLSVDCIQPGNRVYTIGRADIRGVDFTTPGRWQEFSFEFDRLELGRVQYRALFPAQAGDVGIDCLRIEKIADFTEEELYARSVKSYGKEIPPDLPGLWARSRVDGGGKILELRGARWDGLWRTAEAWKRLDPEISCQSLAWSNLWTKEPEGWPGDYAALFQYDAVVLTCGDLRNITVVGRRMLRDFVQQGGGLILLGGYRSFGKGFMRKSWIEEVAGVEVEGPFDLSRLNRADLVARNGVPDCFAVAATVKAGWYHRVKPLPSAQIRWTAAGHRHPLLVTNTFGKGRVVSILLTPLGAPDANGVFESPDWPTRLAAMVRWVTQR